MLACYVQQRPNLIAEVVLCLNEDIVPDWATGPHCEVCRPGSFGSALASGGGCVSCQCNGHNQTGQCYCNHYTQGPHCDTCLPGYYGDPSLPCSVSGAPTALRARA
ncbi:hypothetical protein AALO_G00174150 [Alosa alosa]|uniref:Laminin EGF-like domain-containing protein n=1 Tax=Alosa alosa TaxID=278164 RepID=A0AAV6G797_9TELE|nr:hypothetical protein AALO_G00174150 [Alosa alosa]